VKWDFNQNLSLTTSVFEIDQDVTEGDGTGNYFAVESDIQGFEAQLQGQFNSKWFVSAGYSYLDGEINDEQDATVDGNRPRELPEHMFSIWNRYQLTEKLGLGLGVIYQDDTYITGSNDTELPGYVRVDAAAYYQISEDLRLQLNIENLTDELYFPHAHGDHQVTVGAPIHATFSISGRF
jgi:catecholate siderophore receptor